MSAWQILQAVETLPLRLERHYSNALRLALHLPGHPAVSWVRYPGLSEHPQHALVQRQRRGGSGLLAFGVRGGVGQDVKFIESAQFMSHRVKIDHTRTLISHPASITHRQLDAAQQLGPACTRDGAHLRRAGAHRRHLAGRGPVVGGPLRLKGLEAAPGA